VQTNSKELL